MSREMIDRWAMTLESRSTIERFWEWTMGRFDGDARLNDLHIGKMLDEFHCINRTRLDQERRAYLSATNIRSAAPAPHTPGKATDQADDSGKLRGSMRVRPYGGTYIAKVRIGTTTYRASCTSCEDQAAKNLAEKVQKERCAERVTLSVGTPGADTGPELKGETHYLLTVWEGGAA